MSTQYLVNYRLRDENKAWTSKPVGVTFDSVDDAYRTICETIGKEPGYCERDGIHEVWLSDDEVFQIIGRWERKVEGSKGDTYYVRYRPLRTANGSHVMCYTCTCPSFNLRGYAECKHIRKILEIGV